MASFLDDYGVVDARRAKRRKQIIIGAVIAIVVGVSGFLYFQNFSEERTVNRFLDLLKEKNYQAAYQLWSTPEAQKLYPPAKFVEDWGPVGVYKDTNALRIRNVDACDDFVVVGFSYPNAEDFGLRVDRADKIISYAPWARCPGAHWQIMEFLKSRFGGSK